MSASRRSRRPGDPWRGREEDALLLRSVLGFAAVFAGPLRGLGIDYPVFREVLRVRLTLDRRPGESSANPFGTAAAALGVVLAWFAGVMTGLVALLSESTELWLVLSQGTLFLLLGFTLLQSLLGILVDPTDVRVLAAHPVPDRTFFAARLVQLFANTFVLAAAFTLGNMLLACIHKPLLPVLILCPMLALSCTLTALGAVALLVAVLLRVAGPERFQRVVLWVQITCAAGLAGGIQILPRALGPGLWRALVTSTSDWKLLLFPFASARVFATASGTAAFSPLALVVLLVLPAAALVFTLRLASRHYLAGLQGTLEGNGQGSGRWSGRAWSRVAACFSRSPAQRLGFDFARALSRREGHVLRGALPQFFSMQGMAVAVCLRHGDDFMGAGYVSSLSAGLLALVLPNVLQLCQSTPTPEASWLFAAAPLGEEAEAEIMRGSLKGLFVLWYGLGTSVVILVQLLLLGPIRLPLILLALELSLVLALVFARRHDLGVPFCRPVQAGHMASAGLMMGVFLGLFLLTGTHWLLSHWWILHLVSLVLLPFVIVRQWRAIDRLPVAKSMSLGRRGAAG